LRHRFVRNLVVAARTRTSTAVSTLLAQTPQLCDPQAPAAVSLGVPTGISPISSSSSVPPSGQFEAAGAAFEGSCDSRLSRGQKFSLSIKGFWNGSAIDWYEWFVSGADQIVNCARD